MPLPSENALAVQYGTSRPTIRRAIGLLVEKSLVIRQPGIGSIVASQPRSNKERKLKIGIDWNPSESFHNTAFYSDKLLSGILARRGTRTGIPSSFCPGHIGSCMQKSSTVLSLPVFCPRARRRAVT